MGYKLEYLSEELKGIKEFIKSLVSLNGFVPNLSQNLKTIKVVVINQMGEYASQELKADKRIFNTNIKDISCAQYMLQMT